MSENLEATDQVCGRVIRRPPQISNGYFVVAIFMAAKSEIRLTFSVLIYPEDAWWIAHCLEMDLPAEGHSPREALESLFDIARLQIETAIEQGDLKSIFSAAPPELWKQFAEARDFADRPTRPPPSNVELVNVRELVPVGV